MTFLPNQRPTAPWSDHNYWGQFDLAANLPNTASSTIQVSGDELQRGDIAWAQTPGALFVCIDPTPGAAVWSQMPLAVPATGGAVELWVDGDNGSDLNPGTAAEPLQTVDAALAQIPTVLERDYVVHVLEAPIQGAYQAPSLERQFFCGSFRLAIVGEGFTASSSGTLTGFTNSNGNPYLLTDNTQAWTDDEHLVRFVRFLDGPAAGSILSVVENDATTIRTAAAGVNAAVGNAYEIGVSSVELTGFDFVGGGEARIGIFDRSGLLNPQGDGGVMLVNLQLTPNVGSFIALDGYVQVYGSRLNQGLTVSQVRCGFGYDLSFLNSALITRGQGAGLMYAGSGALRIVDDFSGVLTAEAISTWSDGPNTARTSWEILAGRLYGGGNTALFLSRGLSAYLGSGTAQSSVGRMLVRPGLGESMAFGVQVQEGSIVSLVRGAQVECTDPGSVALLAIGPGAIISVEASVGSIDGDTRGALAQGGGQIRFHGNGANIRTGGSNVAAVDAGGTTADTGGGGAFTTNFDFVSAATGDGSTVRRVDD